MGQDLYDNGENISIPLYYKGVQYGTLDLDYMEPEDTEP